MAWQIEFERAAQKELDKLDKPVARRILKFLYQRVGKLDDPRKIGQRLQGTLSEFWKYRVGDSGSSAPWKTTGSWCWCSASVTAGKFTNVNVSPGLCRAPLRRTAEGGRPTPVSTGYSPSDYSDRNNRRTPSPSCARTSLPSPDASAAEARRSGAL